MFVLLRIYFLFNLYFILIKCDPLENLSVRKTDKKLIQKLRQDTRDMCKIFNYSEGPKASLPVEALPANKYEKRKKELKLNENKKEILNKRKHRIRRAVDGMNSMDFENQNSVETNIIKMNDDMLKKGQKTAYKRNEIPEAIPEQKAKGYYSTAKKSGRRFPFAPHFLDDRTTTKRIETVVNELPGSENFTVRFGKGILPYYIDSKTYDNQLAETIINAFEYFEKTTCIRLQRLREKPTDEKSLNDVLWFYITNPSGIRQCVHSNEKAEIHGVQMITFGYDCMSQGDIAHEIMHLLGFAHEHVRPDRDQYISILWENIKPGYMQYFEVHNATIVENLPYDYASIMHYPPRAFSRNGKATIMAERGIKIGQREGLSELDVQKVSILYSNECIKRNREYLMKTCPPASNVEKQPAFVKEADIEDYFGNRLWHHGVVNYKFKLPMEFSTEEIDNINAVIKHIQKETCVEFQDISNSTIQNTIPDDNSNSIEVGLSDSPEQDELRSSSSSLNFNAEELERLVILDVSEENYTRGNKGIRDILQNTSNGPIKMPSDKIETKANADDKHFLFDFNTARKDNINSSVKGTDVMRNYTKKGAKREANIGGFDTNIGANGNHINVGNKVKTTDVTSSKAAGLRRKRAVPPTPTRRDNAKVLQLARSPLPGCACPKPGTYNITINADCFNTVNDLLHVFVHVLGLDHQHNMHDRDDYIYIDLNMLNDDDVLQDKLPEVASLGFPYDYHSVMHYPWLRIKDGQTKFMYPIWNDGWAMGHWQGLSTTDVQKIQLLYSEKCYERTKQKANEQNDNSVAEGRNINDKPVSSSNEEDDDKPVSSSNKEDDDKPVSSSNEEDDDNAATIEYSDKNENENNENGDGPENKDNGDNDDGAFITD